MEELRVIITADASGVGPGVAEATAQVQASADAIASAQQKATAATKQLAEAQLQLGRAAEEGNAAAAGIIQEYAAASASAQAELQALTAAQDANTASTIKNTAAQEADTKITYNRMEAMGSARVAMGAMSGSMGTMGMGLARIAAGSQLVGPLLANMVPLAIMAAGVVLAYDLGEAIYKAFDLGGEAALAYQKALDGIDESTRTLVDSTALEADKIEAANLKLEHLPNPNAQKEAIDEALVDADKMAAKLDGIIDKEEKLLTMQGAAGSGLQRFFTNEAAPRQEGVDLAQHARYLEQATTLEQQLAESKSFVANEQARVNELTSKQVALDALRNTSMEARVGMWAVGVSQYGKEIDSLNQIIAQENKVTQGIQDQIRVRDAQTKHDSLTQSGKTSGTRGVRENYEQEAAALKLQGANLGEILLFWERINADGEHNTEVLRAQDDLLRQINAKSGIEARATKGQSEVQPRDINASGPAGRAETPEQTAQQIDDAIGQQVEAKQRLYEQNLRNIESEERLGLITGKEAAEEALKLQRQAEAAERAPLENRQKQIAPLGTVGLDQQQMKEYEDLQKKLDQIAQKGALERERIAQQEAMRIEQVYKRVATTFNTDFEKAFNEWATKSKTAGQAFGEMLGQMELQVIDFVAKWLLQQAEKWAMTKLLDATGYATQRATQSAANVGMIASDAAVAAAGTMAFYSAIDPMTAPAMAAIAYGETMAYAAGAVMDTGGMMPHMSFAVNTSGSPERVLSPSQTSNFESLVNNGGSRNATLNQTNNFGGGVTKEMLDAHTSRTMSQLRAMIRPEALNA